MGSKRKRNAPSLEPQTLNRREWYYEDRRGIDVISWQSGMATRTRIPWRMLMQSARRCGQLKPKPSAGKRGEKQK